MSKCNVTANSTWLAFGIGCYFSTASSDSYASGCYGDIAGNILDYTEAWRGLWFFGCLSQWILFEKIKKDDATMERRNRNVQGNWSDAQKVQPDKKLSNLQWFEYLLLPLPLRKIKQSNPVRSWVSLLSCSLLRGAEEMGLRKAVKPEFGGGTRSFSCEEDYIYENVESELCFFTSQVSVHTCARTQTPALYLFHPTSSLFCAGEAEHH